MSWRERPSVEGLGCPERWVVETAIARLDPHRGKSSWTMMMACEILFGNREGIFLIIAP
jgi:hypothetical protein